MQRSGEKQARVFRCKRVLDLYKPCGGIHLVHSGDDCHASDASNASKAGRARVCAVLHPH
jgi:hypothetical protein